MAIRFKKIGKAVLKLTLALVSIVLVLGILLQLAGIAALGWLETGKGKSWLTEQLTAVAKNSGYQVTLDTASYTIVDGLTVNQLRVADRDGVFAEADKLSLSLDYSTLLARKLALSFSGNTLHLIRLPVASQEEKPDTPLEPFIVPDLYFTSFALNDFKVERLILDEAITGQAVELAARISADVVRNENIFDLDLSGTIIQPEPAIAFLPQRINLSGVFTTDQLLLDLRKIFISSPDYQVSGEGNVDLKPAGPLLLSIKAGSQNLAPLAGQAGSANLSVQISGSVDAPLINANGDLALDDLASKGLGKVLFSLASENLRNQPAGTFSLETTYQEKPVQLSASYIYDAPVVRLNEIKGNAPQAEVSGQINVDTSVMLANGDIKATVSDFMEYSELLGIPLAGSAELALAVNDKQGKQAATIGLAIKDGRYDAYSVRRLTASASVPDVSSLWPETMDLQADQIVLGADANFTTLKILLKKTEGDDYSLTLNGNGEAVQPFQLKGSADLQGLQANEIRAKNISLSVSSKGSSISLAGSASAKEADLKVTTADFSLSSLPVALPEMADNLKISGMATLNGKLSDPVFSSELALSPLSVGKNIPDVSLSFKGGYKDGNANISLNGLGDGIKVLRGNASLPLTLSLQPFAFNLPETTPLKGSLEFSLAGQTLAAALLPPDHRFSGDMAGQVKVGGTMSVPQISGNVTLAGGQYLYIPYGIRLADLTMQADLSGKQISLKTLSAHDGAQGKLSASGVFDMEAPSLTRLSLQVSNFHLLRSKTVDGVLSADLNLQGRDQGYALSGTITPAEVDIIIPERFKSDIPELNIIETNVESGPPAALKVITLDMKVSAENQIFVRGWGLDAEFGGDISITGNLSDPQLNGDFKSLRGRYEEFGKRFTLARANLRFQGSVPPSPYLDIEATTNAEDVVASVLLTGAVAKPQISFASVPALPNDEILSRILFGRTMNKITPFQAVQLAQTLQRFSGKGGGGFDPISSIRTATGLDDISVNTDEAGETSVGVGKYLTDKVYLQLEKGKGETSGAASLQVEVTPNITVESEVGQDAQAGGGVFWKWDY